MPSVTYQKDGNVWMLTFKAGGNWDGPYRPGQCLSGEGSASDHLSALLSPPGNSLRGHNKKHGPRLMRKHAAGCVICNGKRLAHRRSHTEGVNWFVPHGQLSIYQILSTKHFQDRGKVMNHGNGPEPGSWGPEDRATCVASTRIKITGGGRSCVEVGGPEI